MTEQEILKACQKVVGLRGMTVNERLFASGLINAFDTAKKKDKQKAILILRCLKVDEISIKQILNLK